MDQKNNDIPASEMTLRDRFALAAIGSHQGLMFESASSRACFARAAYMFADSMLEAREEGHEEYTTWAWCPDTDPGIISGDDLPR